MSREAPFVSCVRSNALSSHRMGAKPNDDDVFEGQQLLQTGIFGVLYTVSKVRLDDSGMFLLILA